MLMKKVPKKELRENNYHPSDISNGRCFPKFIPLKILQFSPLPSPQEKSENHSLDSKWIQNIEVISNRLLLFTTCQIILIDPFKIRYKTMYLKNTLNYLKQKHENWQTYFVSLLKSFNNISIKSLLQVFELFLQRGQGLLVQ